MLLLIPCYIFISVTYTTPPRFIKEKKVFFYMALYIYIYIYKQKCMCELCFLTLIDRIAECHFKPMLTVVDTLFHFL